MLQTICLENSLHPHITWLTKKSASDQSVISVFVEIICARSQAIMGTQVLVRVFKNKLKQKRKDHTFIAIERCKYTWALADISNSGTETIFIGL